MNINTAEYWDKVWGTEGAKTWRTYPASFDKIVQLIGTGKRVLDVGGGVGVLANHLKQAGNEARIVDISPVAVQIAKACFGITGSSTAVPPLREASNSCDYIVAKEMRGNEAS